jgi:hypothetical protein
LVQEFWRGVEGRRDEILSELFILEDFNVENSHISLD